MLEAIALVTFLLANGSETTRLIYPPGGDYHKQFAPMCHANRQRISEQVRGMIKRREITEPATSVGVGQIRVYCLESYKA